MHLAGSGGQTIEQIIGTAGRWHGTAAHSRDGVNTGAHSEAPPGGGCSRWREKGKWNQSVTVGQSEQIGWHASEGEGSNPASAAARAG